MILSLSKLASEPAAQVQGLGLCELGFLVTEVILEGEGSLGQELETQSIWEWGCDFLSGAAQGT